METRKQSEIGPFITSGLVGKMTKEEAKTRIREERIRQWTRHPAARYGVNPKTGRTYPLEDFEARIDHEYDIWRRQFRSAIIGVLLGVIALIGIVVCMQSGHAPIF